MLVVKRYAHAIARVLFRTLWCDLAALTLIAAAAFMVYPPAGVAAAGIALAVAAYRIDKENP